MNPEPQDTADAESDNPRPHAQQAPAAPPATPRGVTPFIRRRALTEPRTRFWLVAAIVLFLITLYFIANTLHAKSHEAWLIAHGTPITAKIIMANEEYVANRRQRPDSVVILGFNWKGEKFETGIGKLPGRKEFIVTGSMLPIHVNPDNPNDWTWLDEPLPILTRAIAAILTFPVVLITLLWVMVVRGRILRTWREGQAVEALVVATRSTAIAPSCRAVDVTPNDENENRVYTVYLPPRLSKIEVGDALYILFRNRRSSSAIAAAWFE